MQLQWMDLSLSRLPKIPSVRNPIIQTGYADLSIAVIDAGASPFKNNVNNSLHQDAAMATPAYWRCTGLALATFQINAN